MRNYRFNSLYVRRYENARPWRKFCLWFMPMQVAFDFGYSRVDGANMLYYKVWGEMVYIIGEIRT